MLSVNYQYTNDIDWFCIQHNQHIHVASNGHTLPIEINNEQILAEIQHYVANMPLLYKYKLNRDYLNQILNDGRYEHIEHLSKEDIRIIIPVDVEIEEDLSPQELTYCWSFIEMAQKGFFSYDRGDDGYHLIAQPTELLDDSQTVNYPPNLPQLESEDIPLINSPEK